MRRRDEVKLVGKPTIRFRVWRIDVYGKRERSATCSLKLKVPRVDVPKSLGVRAATAPSAGEHSHKTVCWRIQRQDR
jgi:hypothetical protein